MNKIWGKIYEKIAEIQQHTHKEIQNEWVVKISQVCTLKGVDSKKIISKIKKKIETCTLKGIDCENTLSKLKKKIDYKNLISKIEKKTEVCQLKEVDSEENLSKVDEKSAGMAVFKIKVNNIGRFLYKIIETETLNEEQVIPIRMYFPNEETLDVGENGQNQLPVIIYLHGHPGIENQYDDCDSICNALSKYTRRLVINVDYRYEPEYNFQTGLQDCYEVTRQICMNEFTYGINTHKITIMGEGIGGGLAERVCYMAKEMQEFEIKNQILICPILTSSDINNSSRTLIITAEEDSLCNEGLEYVTKMKDAGLDVTYKCLKKEKQGYFNLGTNKVTVRQSLREIYRFLR